MIINLLHEFGLCCHVDERNVNALLIIYAKLCKLGYSFIELAKFVMTKSK